MHRLLAGFLVAVALGGCAGPQPEEDVAVWLGEPHPRGDEWPVGLAGPFGLLPIESVRVPSFDGTVLDGWILRPEVDAQVPVVLWTAPYFGQCSFLPALGLPPDGVPEYPVCGYATGDDASLRDASSASEAVPIDRLISDGYAVAVFNVRGTGNSGGCFEWFGQNEQQDQAELVEWLGTREWSNGRVAMMGLSYHGTTPWEAAILNPEHLKTIVVAGMVGDAYTFSHTPQGATFAISSVFQTHFFWRVSGSPPLHGPIGHYTVDHLDARMERVCPETVDMLREEFSGTFTDFRNGPYWDERRLIDRFPDITASVFLTHGFDDHVGSGHQQQENAVFHTLNAPKRMMEGQWGHMMPDMDPEFEDTYGQHWHDVVVEWFDYWLKGIGEPAKLGLVEYQDARETWHTSTSWPPAEQQEEVLYLHQGGLATAPGQEQASFRSMPGNFPEEILCGNTLPSLGEPGVVYFSEPVTEATFVAGNPIAYLQVESDLPGGLVAIDLYGVADGCDQTYWGRGVADLRFHDGRFTGRDFPTGAPLPVRIDITNFAEWLEPGGRVGVVVSFGNVVDRTGQPYHPAVTLHGDGSPGSSHVVLPVIEGGFGGQLPELQYPPRPFVPAEGQRPDSR